MCATDGQTHEIPSQDSGTLKLQYILKCMIYSPVLHQI